MQGASPLAGSHAVSHTAIRGEFLLKLRYKLACGGYPAGLDCPDHILQFMFVKVGFCHRNHRSIFLLILAYGVDRGAHFVDLFFAQS